MNISHKTVLARKQVLVVRKDLNMRKGKIAAQVAHASMGALLSKAEVRADGSRLIPNHPDILAWLDGPFAKICVYVNSEEELLAIHQKAKDAGLINCLITDSGRTEFKGVPTNTVVAVGPGIWEEVDKVTGVLPLL